MNQDLFDALEKSNSAAAKRALQDLDSARTVDVIYRSQVGACLPFTPLPLHYFGKKVAIVIVGEADE
ncbi:hypothetical protein [Stenotrophomonas sp. 2694]|jgi:hypothetical protein|uniref:hypothetical protein n=1 Tax=Stenotrophomonas sp. 2694 TaxID=3156317 RepID=UPI00339B2940